MPAIRTIRSAISSLTLTLLLISSGVSGAQDKAIKSDAQGVPDQQGQVITDADIQMLRTNLRSQRKQMIAANMKLTDAEAEKFWPIYDQYIAELVKNNNTKYDLIKQYVQQQGNLTDAQADAAVQQWIQVDESVAQLRLKYVPLFRKVLSAKGTAQFYQVDRRIQLMIDLQLASALPIVEP
jgi:Spy/CpxP family protein refolding chaperone